MVSATRAPSKRTVPVQAEADRRGLPVEHVREIQRSRIIAAMVEVVPEHGASNVTVAHIVARSGISRRTFYEIFKDCDDCLLATLDDAIGQADRAVMLAHEREYKWHEWMRASLTALLELFDERPAMARFLVVDSLGAGPRALERRGTALARVTAAVDKGRDEAKGSYRPSTLTAEGVVGGALSIIQTRLLEADREPLTELVNPLMGMIVLPYLGLPAVGRELEHSPSKSREAAAPRSSDPLRTVGMRLTYRTVCVLLSVAAQPGSSNREIAVASGIADQGQISKLLGRLEGLGLVCNEHAEPGRGSPNAWKLTRKGEHVGQALSAGKTRVVSLQGV
jgi:AcrR family transcriptional regulator